MLDCSLPIPADHIVSAHGAGGRRSQELLDKIFLPLFTNEYLDQKGDGACHISLGGKIAMASDSFVVQPLFFPGGDIGKLAVCGVSNDLAMCGAIPRYLSVNWILEEGLPLSLLQSVASSLAAEAKQQSMLVVTGDTKVVEKGKGDQIFLSVTGIGEHLPDWAPQVSAIREGDQLLLSGDLARHGLAVLSVREKLGVEIPFVSDCAPLFPLVKEIHSHGLRPRALRDLTRGGLASTLWEWALSTNLGFFLDQDLPLLPEVKGLSELLGLDPIQIANEGTMAVVVKSSEAEATLKVLKKFSPWACRIGSVSAGPASVLWKRVFGAPKRVEWPSNNPLPRIC